MRGNDPQREPVRVGIVSDTHGFLDPRIQAVVEACDIAIHAGDVCDAAVLSALRPRSGRVIAVAGNNDTIVRKANPTMESLPPTAELVLPGGRIAIEHGHRHGLERPCHRKLRAAHPGARAIVYGHTHRPVLDDSAWPWVLNPGAAGRTRTQGGPSCAVLTAHPEGWHVEIRRFETLQANRT
jgi:putative phosphoesterase